MKESQIKRIAAETQTTAQVIRATNKSISTQTGGVRNTTTSSAGAQTEQPTTTDRSTGTQRFGQRAGTQTDRVSTTTGDTQTEQQPQEECKLKNQQHIQKKFQQLIFSVYDNG